MGRVENSMGRDENRNCVEMKEIFVCLRGRLQRGIRYHDCYTEKTRVLSFHEVH
jgi:hypothetical protein